MPVGGLGVDSIRSQIEDCYDKLNDMNGKAYSVTVDHKTAETESLDIFFDEGIISDKKVVDLRVRIDQYTVNT